jgi:hypothetical protein
MYMHVYIHVHRHDICINTYIYMYIYNVEQLTHQYCIMAMITKNNNDTKRIKKLKC